MGEIYKAGDPVYDGKSDCEQCIDTAQLKQIDQLLQINTHVFTPLFETTAGRSRPSLCKL